MPVLRPAARVAVALLSLFLTGCGEAGDGPATPETPSDPTPLRPLGLDRPAALPAALEGVANPATDAIAAYLGVLNLFAGAEGWIVPPETRSPRRGDGTGVFFWVYGEVSVRTVVSETDTRYRWDVFISGTLGTDTFVDYHYYHAEEEKDGSCGLFRFLAPEGVTAYVWTYCAAGESSSYAVGVGQDDDRFEIDYVVEPSGAGHFYVYESDPAVPTLLIDWAATGAGSFAAYEGGVKTQAFTWDAPDPRVVQPAGS
jgi:hypothetical protein